MIRKLLSFIIITVRPLLGPAACRFHVSCTRFALQVLEKKCLHKALFLICRRLLSCHPFTK